MQIFNKYVQCHLSPPDGLRTEKFDDVSVDCGRHDREEFKEQLIIIGNFGRENPGHSLTILSKLLEEKTRQLHSHLMQATQCNDMGNMMVMRALGSVFEDIHWLLLIAGHVIAMESVGEQPIIPSEIMNHSVEQLSAGAVDITTSLKVLASPSQCITQIPNAENVCDAIIRLVAAVFRLCEIENKAIEYKLKLYLSTEVTSDIMWFLTIWAEPYLFMLTEYYATLSESLQMAFGLDTPGGNWTLNFILNKICVNVTNFNGESEIIDDSVALFVSLVKRKHK